MNRKLPSVTYKALIPHIPQLLQSIIFPILYFTEEDQQLWDSDPEESIRLEHGMAEYL